MADPRKRLIENVAGDFFVDSTCIDCDTCRQLAPHTFGETGEFSHVHTQPHSPGHRRDALHAVVSCPTGSIGTLGPDQPRDVFGDFPLPIEPPVYLCGFNSRKSFGGNSYFLKRDDGNWLIDSPRFLPQLVRRLEALGGVSGIFLTHRDDVADADRYAAHFGCDRVIHELERSAQPRAERILRGEEPVCVARGLLAIPTPGHTRGHCCLLADDRFLFTGDHLAHDRSTGRLTAFRDYCWHSWDKQVASMRRLLDFDFEWVLPGHGERVHRDSRDMRRELVDLVERMRDGQFVA